MLSSIALALGVPVVAVAAKLAENALVAASLLWVFLLVAGVKLQMY